MNPPLTKRTLLLYLTAVFLVGALAGWIAGAGYTQRKAFHRPPPEDFAKFVVNDLKAKLHLAPDQVEKIRPLIVQTILRIQTLHQESFEQVWAAIDQTDRQITPLLSPEQQTKFEALRRERDANFRQHNAGPATGASRPGPTDRPARSAPTNAMP